jgi:hypothetical protein
MAKVSFEPENGDAECNQTQERDALQELGHGYHTGAYHEITRGRAPRKTSEIVGNSETMDATAVSKHHQLSARNRCAKE